MNVLHAPSSVLVVEDEPRLREALVALLKESARPFREILQAGDADQALRLLLEYQPDLAFLDIRLPGMSGLELARRLPTKTQIVFVTAYDAHAIQAFEAGAVDYLLKPVTKERLDTTLERVFSRAPISQAALLNVLGGLLPVQRPNYLEWITAQSGKKTFLIAVEDILGFKSDHKYTRVICKDSSCIIEQPLRELIEKLNPSKFMQIHRSAIVNLKAIAWIEKHEGDTATLHVKNHSETLPVSEKGYRALRSRGTD